MAIFNQFSFVIFAVVLGVALLVGLRYIPNRSPSVRLGITGVYLLVIVFIGLQFRYPASPVDVETVADVEAMLSNNQPTLVMLYSNY